MAVFLDKMSFQPTDLKQQIKAINLADIVRAEGVELKSRGGRAVGRCPFHDDHDPSFVVFNDGHFKCYGCGEYGDAVDFIQRLHGLHGFDFKEALRYLNITPGPISKKTRRKIQEANRLKAEKDKRKQRLDDLIYTLGLLISATHQAAEAWKSPTDMDKYGEIYHPLPYWEFCYETLCLGNDEDRNEAIEALKDMDVIQHKPTWNEGFDFPAWLKNFFNGEPHEEEYHRIKISFV